jgi:hypothetical protein
LAYVDFQSNGNFEQPSCSLHDKWHRGEESTWPYLVRTINIPASASLGKNCYANWNKKVLASTDPCGDASQPEEFEDYVVNVMYVNSPGYK